jgi:cytochrome c-type biogenesis protein CcsB
MTALLNVALGLYLAALALAGVQLAWRRRAIGWLGLAALAGGACVLTAYLGLRWHAAGRAPFGNMFESLVLMAWALPAVFLLLHARLRAAWLSAPTALLAVLSLAYAGTYSSDIQPLMPALHSNWLFVHVFTCFLGYAGLGVAFAAAIIYLATTCGASARNPESSTREAVIARTTAFGFFFLTVGIITGSVWANAAWGTYWSWDPKETWALITWLIYAFFLHSRRLDGWRGRRSAWVSIIGFVSVIFTYFGVNLLMAGLHSYAR